MISAFQTLLAYSSEPSGEEKLLIILVFVIGIPLSIVSLAVAVLKNKRSKELFGKQHEDNESVVEHARVMEKTAEKDELLQCIVRRIVFETPDGKRLSLTVKDETTYQTVVKDDTGTLRHQGKTLISFTRQTKQN